MASTAVPITLAQDAAEPGSGPAAGAAAIPPGGREVTVPAVAVFPQPNGTFGGAVNNITIRVAPHEGPGPGSVFVATDPLIDLDIQGVARIAAQVGAEMAGAEPDALDVFIRADVPETGIVGGGSAGAAMTVGVAAAITGAPINQSVAMTGTVTPDWGVGEVSGLLTKLKTVAGLNFTTFVVPQGQTTVRSLPNETLPRDVPAGAVQHRGVVNLTTVGAGMGVAVEGAATTVEAYEAFTGQAPPEAVRSGDVRPGPLAANLADTADTELRDAAEAVERAQRNVTAPALPANAPALQALANATDALERARELDRQDRPVAVVLAATEAVRHAREASALADLAATPNKQQAVDTAIQQAQRAVERGGANVTPPSLTAVPFAALAAGTAALGEDFLAFARMDARAGRPEAAVRSAALAAAFVEESRAWAALAEGLTGDQAGPEPAPGTVANLTTDLAGLANERLTLGSIIAPGPMPFAVNSTVLNAGFFMNRSLALLDQDRDLAGLFFAMIALSNADGVLATVGGEEPVAEEDVELRLARAQAVDAIRDARRGGAEPLLAVGLLGEADRIRHESAFDAVVEYQLAEIAADVAADLAAQGGDSMR